MTLGDRFPTIIPDHWDKGVSVPLLKSLFETHPAPSPPPTSPQRLCVLETKSMSVEAAWLSSGRPSRMLMCPATPLRPRHPEELRQPTEAEHLWSTGTEWETKLD